MHVCFSAFAEVGAVKGDGGKFYVFASGLVGEVALIVHFCGTFWSRAGSVALVGEFVHVEPESGEGYLVVEVLQHVEPELGGVWVEVVDEDRVACPNFADEVAALGCLDEDIATGALLEGVAGAVAGCRFDDGDVAVAFGDVEEAVEREAGGVDGEGLELVHVVDVRPNGVEGESIFLILFEYIFDFGDVVVAPSALVEAESPEGRDVCCSYEVMELVE